MCTILGHRYKVERPPSRKNDDEAGKIVRCERCGHEKTVDGSPGTRWPVG
jgi:transcription elongation factor Elf1